MFPNSLLREEGRDILELFNNENLKNVQAAAK
jgi:hypothetical protein